MMLMPLKHVEPFVIRVDNTTGVVDVVPVFAGGEQMPETVTRYLLDHYVTVCERFNFSTAESDYEECGAFHSAGAQSGLVRAMGSVESRVPLNLYKDGTSMRAQVGAVSFFKRGTGFRISRRSVTRRPRGRAAAARTRSRIGSRPSSTFTASPPKTRASVAGIRSGSRSSTSAPSLKSCRARTASAARAGATSAVGGQAMRRRSVGFAALLSVLALCAHVRSFRRNPADPGHGR